MTFDNVLAAFFEGWSCSFRAFQQLLLPPRAPSAALPPPPLLPPTASKSQLLRRFATDRPLLLAILGSHTPGSRARLDQRDRGFWQLQRDDRQERRPLLPDPLQPRPITVFSLLYINIGRGIRQVGKLNFIFIGSTNVFESSREIRAFFRDKLEGLKLGSIKNQRGEKRS